MSTGTLNPLFLCDQHFPGVHADLCPLVSMHSIINAPEYEWSPDLGIMARCHTEPWFSIQAERWDTKDRTPEDVSHVFRVFQALLKVIILDSPVLISVSSLLNLSARHK